MRIVFITSCAEPSGGSEELWAGTAERLHARNLPVLAVRSRAPESLEGVAARAVKAGIALKDYRPARWERVFRAVGRRFYLWRQVERWLSGCHPIRRWLRSFDAELAVISQSETYDGICGFTNLAQTCEDARLPYVLVCQKASEDKWPLDEERKTARRAFSRARKIFFVSEHNRTCTQRQLALPLPHAEVIWNPFTTWADGPLRWPQPDGDAWRLACVARLSVRDKGQDLLLSVLARDRWRGRRLEVAFVGAGDNARGLGEMAGMLGLTSVRFPGFSTDITQVWRDHHALILPSRHEGLPLALVEAMRCGRMGIVTDAGGNAEVVTDGQTGFVAGAATADALDEAMERAWTRRQTWEQIGLEAARQIRRRVPEDPCGVFVEKLAAVHAEIDEEKSASGR